MEEPMLADGITLTVCAHDCPDRIIDTLVEPER
jgi:hypothetical protein